MPPCPSTFKHNASGGRLCATPHPGVLSTINLSFVSFPASSLARRLSPAFPRGHRWPRMALHGTRSCPSHFHTRTVRAGRTEAVDSRPSAPYLKLPALDAEAKCPGQFCGRRKQQRLIFRSQRRELGAGVRRNSRGRPGIKTTLPGTRGKRPGIWY